MKEGWSYRGGAGVGERDSFRPAGESVNDSEEIVKKQQFLEKLWLTPNSRMPAPNGQICLFVNCMFCVKVFKIGKVNPKFFNEYLKKRNGSWGYLNCKIKHYVHLCKASFNCSSVKVQKFSRMGFISPEHLTTDFFVTLFKKALWLEPSTIPKSAKISTLSL